MTDNWPADMTDGEYDRIVPANQPRPSLRLRLRNWRRSIRRRFRIWNECRQQRCDYYRHYLAYGPADMPHATYHAECKRAEEHFKNCTYTGQLVDSPGSFLGMKLTQCSVCSSFERRLRA